MSISSKDFRDVLRHFPSGVTVVTIKSGDQIHGLTVSAFASISPKPPQIMIAIDHNHSAFPMLESEEVTFAVNFLGQEQSDLSNRFAWTKDEDRFDDIVWYTAATGAPILKNTVAWLDCIVKTSMSTGTHTIYIGEVIASSVQKADHPPLVYWNRGYRHLNLSKQVDIQEN
ncbi:MAG: flavin reductase family protein [Anaerolineae bacterium]|nr:MAG: flavin reductase family protein [Anaerolineae bacterium]